LKTRQLVFDFLHPRTDGGIGSGVSNPPFSLSAAMWAEGHFADHKNRSHVRFLASQLLSDTGANRVTAAGAKSVRERTGLSARTLTIVELAWLLARLFV
jgi:hypothetical protein